MCDDLDVAVEGMHSSGTRIRLTLTLSEVVSGDETMFIAVFEAPRVREKGSERESEEERAGLLTMDGWMAGAGVVQEISATVMTDMQGRIVTVHGDITGTRHHRPILDKYDTILTLQPDRSIDRCIRTARLHQGGAPRQERQPVGVRASLCASRRVHPSLPNHARYVGVCVRIAMLLFPHRCLAFPLLAMTTTQSREP
mgnify:CR=1 FL=1